MTEDSATHDVDRDRDARDEQVDYAEFYDDAPDMLVFADSETNVVVQCNKTLLHTLGFERSEVVGRSVFELYHADSVDDVRELMQALPETGSIRDARFTLRTKAGETIDVRLTVSIVHDRAGHARYTSSAWHDITDRTEIEAALEAANDDLRRIMSSISDYLWSADIIEGGTFTYRYYSPVVEAITGRPPEFYMSDPARWLSTIYPDDVARVLDISARLRSGNVSHVIDQYRIVLPDGSVRWVRDSVKVDPLNNGVRLHGVVTDITAQKEAEEEITRRTAELAHASRLNTLGEMVAGIAHEINQPLSAISLYAGACEETLMKGGEDRDQLIHWTREIAGQATFCGKIISRIRGFAKKAGGEREEFEINSLVRESAELLSSESRDHGVSVHFDLAEPSPRVFAERIQIQQIIVNLVRNACEAVCAIPREERRVILRTRRLRTGIEVCVEDNGPGLPEDEIEDVFGAFATTKSEGLGIGLGLSRSIAENHGGELHIVQNDERGVTARFMLPYGTSGGQHGV